MKLVVSDTQICARHHLWVFINSWVPGYAGAWAHARALSHPCSSSVVSSFSSKILVQLKHSIQKFCLASSAQNLNQDSTRSQAEKMTPRITLGGEGDPQRSEGFQRDPQVRYFQSRKYSKLSIYFFGLQQTKKGVKTKTKLES